MPDPGDTLTGPGGDAQAPPGDASPTGEGGSCPGGQSFTAGTLVLLASGKAVPITSLKAGDKVLAQDTRTGKDQPQTVTAVLVHRDTDLYDLTVSTSHGTEVIHTTSNHLFWDPYHHYWVSANKLSKGEHLKTANGTVAAADGGTVPADHDGWMWDLTVPGNNDHDFYVLPAEDGSGAYYRVDQSGVTAVLVHNCGDGVDPSSGPAPDGSTLEDYAKANEGATNETTPDFVTEFTSASGKRYYGRTELPGEGPIDLEPGSFVDDALPNGGDRVSCSETCAANEAQKAEGPMGAYGGTFRTLRVRSLAAQDAGFEDSGIPVDPCKESCQIMIGNLGGNWTRLRA